ncbi:MAG: Maf family nucleotide pyrophosphatase [Thermodesulfobacteriota bacterium]|nr:Maf family nucleotide pyrophosphatase [Thermodesulfobacteriota bacterium]
MSKQANIILASASPRRRELLASVGITFQVIPSNIEEKHRIGESPSDFVLRLSEEKAAQVAQRSGITGRWVIGSDTIVVCDDNIIGKPTSTQDSSSMLHQLSGRSHQVLSGYAIIDRDNNTCIKRCVTTEVTFRTLTEQEIEGYIATGEPADKAGSYAIQGIGSYIVTGINGSYTNVVGLPMSHIVNDLKSLGAITLFSKTD